MRKIVVSLTAMLCSASAAPADPNTPWTPSQLRQLHSWLAAAPNEGIQLPTDRDFSLALRQAEPPAVRSKATEIAIRLARAHLFGCSSAQRRAGWNIASNDDQIDVPWLLAAALARNDLDGFFTKLRPQHAEYDVLRRALLVETDPGHRSTLMRNLERWRWMPLDMGQRYLLVNVPGFQVGLWENGQKVESWRVIVGKPNTPTPVFSATVSGVILNPWWDVPQSIVAESVGRLARTNPQEARKRGYVWAAGRYRQRPGPTNSLGAMKLVMPNPYRVYLHDTPNKALFEKSIRAFSHGCIRVADALGLAGRLLGRSVKSDTAKGLTEIKPLSAALPVYVTYFTADVSNAGNVAYHTDIYGRDARMGDSRNPVLNCPG